MTGLSVQVANALIELYKSAYEPTPEDWIKNSDKNTTWRNC